MEEAHLLLERRSEGQTSGLAHTREPPGVISLRATGPCRLHALPPERQRLLEGSFYTRLVASCSHLVPQC